MTLYSKHGAQPTHLPPEDWQADGTMWTDLANNPDGREACGWIEAPELPAFDPATQTVAWLDGGWEVQAAPPPPPPPPPEPRRVGRITFLQRIPANRRVDIRTAAKSDPWVEDFLDLLKATDLVELENADTLAGLQYLVGRGLLSQAEVEAILQ